MFRICFSGVARMKGEDLQVSHWLPAPWATSWSEEGIADNFHRKQL